MGYRGKKHIELAGAIELSHTASLLHDDVVDEAQIRRGKLSANYIWGNRISILTGDFLFSKAANVVLKTKRGIPEILLSVMEEMAEGELLQMEKMETKRQTENDYFNIIKRKTAFLMAASCKIGASIAGVSEGYKRLLWNYGLNIGVAFQLIDDSLDYLSDEKILGKSIGKDLREGKMTLPLLFTMKVVDSKKRRYLTDILTGKIMDDSKIKNAVMIIKDAGGIEYTKSVANKKVVEAKSFLDHFKKNIYIDGLYTIADYIVARDF